MNRLDEVVFDLASAIFRPSGQIPDGAKIPLCLPPQSEANWYVADSMQHSFNIAIAAKKSLSPTDSAIGRSFAIASD